MKALLIDTNENPKAIDLVADANGSYLAAMQKAVGGFIEPFDVVFGGSPALYVNDEGVFGCAPNRAIYATDAMERQGWLSQIDDHPAKEGDLYGILFGPILAVGLDRETGETRDITDEEAERVTAYFTSEACGVGSGLLEALRIRCA